MYYLCKAARREAARRGSARRRSGEAGGKKSLRQLYHQFGLIGAQSKSGEAARRRGENCLAASPNFFIAKNSKKNQQKNSKFIWRGGEAIFASPLRQISLPKFPAIPSLENRLTGHQGGEAARQFSLCHFFFQNFFTCSRAARQRGGKAARR